MARYIALIDGKPGAYGVVFPDAPGCAAMGKTIDEALAHARKRQQFGKAIGEFQLVQAMIADSKVEISAARALILETARKRDRRDRHQLQSREQFHHEHGLLHRRGSPGHGHERR